MQGQSARVRAAVVGAGYWGKNLVRNFRAIGSLAAVCDRDPSVETLCRSPSGDVRYEPDFAAVLSDREIDAVALATPAVTHYEMANAALVAGKDLFVEKPLAVELAEGERLVAARRQP
jgi:UDP-2-acetamido-3-amino-2,3-dideoxy-glucuronate N-acetyltransferase